MEHIFKALADPTRQALLDTLRHKDGQTLTELEASLDMTRFGVMKHLKLLENADLIITRKQGRYKYHYLNAAPLQEVMDRWVAPFLQPQAKALIDLKTELERTTKMSKPDFMMQTFIRCTQDALWEALTDPTSMAAYHFLCNRVEGQARIGERLTWILPDGNKMFSQCPTKLDPKSRIEATFEPHFFGPDAPASRMAFLIEPTTGADGTAMCKLTIEHYDMAPGQDGFATGWARLAASLKSYLETGDALKMAM